MRMSSLSTRMKASARSWRGNFCNYCAQPKQTPMADTEPHKNAAPVLTVEYELTDDVARQLALDLVSLRTTFPAPQVPALRGFSPVVVLLGAAAQIVVAIVALLLFGGWDWILAKILVGAGIGVTLILLWKAAYYGV